MEPMYYIGLDVLAAGQRDLSLYRSYRCPQTSVHLTCSCR
jgi:hypothetical protein